MWIILKVKCGCPLICSGTIYVTTICNNRHAVIRAFFSADNLYPLEENNYLQKNGTEIEDVKLTCCHNYLFENASNKNEEKIIFVCTISRF